MDKDSKIVAIAWAPHQDHVEKYAKQLGAQLYYVHYFSFKTPVLTPVKYIPQTLKTFIILIREKPKVIYVLNPPVFAPLIVYLFSVFSGASIIMDCHYSSLYGEKWKWLIPITRFLAKQAAVNIVDQDRNKKLFDSWGAKAVILEKPPYQVTQHNGTAVTCHRFNIAVINTFAEDDPMDVVLEAASLCPDIDWYILGDTQLAPDGLLARASKNVKFTGYLLKEDYWNCLRSANAIMTLTTRAYSLMAGAIDSLSIGKPLILSRQPALEQYFTKGIVFVDNEPSSIVQGIREFQQLERKLISEIISLRDEKCARWEDEFAHLQNIIVQSLGGSLR